MKQTVWNAFYQFKCLADKCSDSCCRGWEVDIDGKTAESYRAMDGELGDRLRQVLKTEDGSTSMILENGRCPMWRQDGLCQIQAQKGHDALCRVCREYPRLFMDYGDFAEWGLEMSCPEAARLLFADMSVTEEEVPGGSGAEYDGDVMACLQDSRRQILEKLEQFSGTVPCYLKKILLYAHEIQSRIDNGDDADVQIGDSSLLPVQEPGDITLLVDFFKGLEILTPRWKERLENPQEGRWDSRLIQFVKYLVRRYWYHAVWDFDLVARAKLIVSSCLLIHYLGGDTVETVQLFCKEIENDPDNMDAILDAAYTQPAFADKNLLGLLIVE